MVEVAQRLLGVGYDLRLFDPQLHLSKLVGSNRRVVDVTLPHLAQLLQSGLAETLDRPCTVVAAQRCAKVDELAAHLTPEHTVLDINGWDELSTLPSKYEGFCW